MSHALIKRLHEERTNAWEQAKALLDAAEAEGRDLTAEENQTYDTINERMGAIDERVTKLREDDERAKASEAAFAALLATPQERQAPQENTALRAFLAGETRSFEVKPDGPVDFRDLTKGTATAGGNTVPTSFYNQLVQHMIEVSGILAAGPTILRTDSGENTACTNLVLPFAISCSFSRVTSGVVCNSSPRPFAAPASESACS